MTRLNRDRREERATIPAISYINRVIHGEALAALTEIPTGVVGMVISDPPFFIGIGRDSGGFGSDPWSDIGSIEAATAWARPRMAEMARVTRKGGAIIVMGGTQATAAWSLAAEDAGLVWMSELTVLWNAGKPRPRNFGSLFTRILWFTVPGARHSWNSRHRAIYSNVLVCNKVPVSMRVHPAQKPVELTTFLISLLSHKTDLILDPFCGSGTTLVSAAVCARPFVGIDEKQQWCTVAANRAAHYETEEEGEIYLWTNGRLEAI